MNILFIYDAPLRSEAGGTERATSLVMAELTRRGHTCTGIIHWDQQKPDMQFLNGKKIDSLYEFLNEHQIEVVVNQIAFHPRFLGQFLAHGGQQWKNEGGKIVSFMHLDPTPEPRKKLITFFTDWNSKSIVGKIKRLIYVLSLPYFNHKTDKEYKLGLRYLYDNSDRYILMSKSFLRVFKELAKLQDTSKVRFIPNMLTFPDIATCDDLSSKENKVLIVARLDDMQKNISFMINAWSHIRNHNGYKLHILGDGQDKEALQKKARNVRDLTFEGAQSPLSWYQKAKIFLMASPREGWGLTITESLQNGVVPIVLNTSTVFKDIITDGENGYLVNNQEQFQDKLFLLMSDENLRTLIACNCLHSAFRFTPRIVGELWEKMLNEI